MFKSRLGNQIKIHCCVVVIFINNLNRHMFAFALFFTLYYFRCRLNHSYPNHKWSSNLNKMHFAVFYLSFYHNHFENSRTIVSFHIEIKTVPKNYFHMRICLPVRLIIVNFDLNSNNKSSFINIYQLDKCIDIHSFDKK